MMKAEGVGLSARFAAALAAAGASRVVAAVSGGPDSMCLLHLLLENAASSGLRVLAAHLEHGIRGDEAVEDMRFVEDFCRRHGVPLVDFQARLGGEVSEAAARKARLEFLRLVACAWRANAVLLAHHADDLVETMLFRMLRGVPPEGLPGFRMVEEVAGMRLVRPLHAARRAEIIAYLEERHVPYRLDSSNLSSRYVRNALRREVLPQLERLVPGTAEALRQLATELAENAELVAQLATAAAASIITCRMPGFAVLARQAFAAAAPPVRRWLLETLAPAAGRSAHTRICELEDGAKLALVGGVTARRDGNLLHVCQPAALPKIPEPLRLPAPGKVRLPDGSLLRARLAPAATARKRAGRDPLVEYVSASTAAAGYLLVRNRRAGDRFRPLGAPGSRKLKTFFNGCRLPHEIRGVVPLVLVPADGAIAWVAGVRIAEKFRLKKSDAKALELAVSPRRRSFVRTIAALAARHRR